MKEKHYVELTFGVIIEGELEKEGDYDEIGELVAADMYEIFNNGEDTFEVYYRGVEKCENPGL